VRSRALRIANEIAKKAPNKMPNSAAVSRATMMRVPTKPAWSLPALLPRGVPAGFDVR
jgi:hypothetical protein